jgi:cytochrome c553
MRCPSSAGDSLLRVGFVLCAVPGCGDLVIPSNGTDDGGGDDSTTASGTGDQEPVARPPPDCDAGTEPVALACTGLYSNWTQLVLAADVQAFQPGATMWADGADSSRWIWLPPGQKIDTTDLNNWSFPVGTKIWQEFRLLGQRIETRFLWKEATSIWFRTTFVWNEDLSAAPAMTAGVPNARGLPYEIPAVSACERCHGGEKDFVLGFEIVSLSMPQSSGLNLQALVRQNALSNPPAVTPSIPGGDLATIDALAFLHANCGTSCHNTGPSAGASVYGLFLKLTTDATGLLPSSVQGTPTWTTTYKVPSNLTPSGYDAGGFWRIAPGDVTHSSIVWTASRRDGVTQMPPIASHLVDQNDVALLSAWIRSLTP